MGFSRWRRGKDGKPRYTPYYRDLRGREASAGTFARKAGADAAWHAAEANARAGLRHDPGRSGKGSSTTSRRYGSPTTGWSCPPGRACCRHCRRGCRQSLMTSTSGMVS